MKPNEKLKYLQLGIKYKHYMYEYPWLQEYIFLLAPYYQTSNTITRLFYLYVPV